MEIVVKLLLFLLRREENVGDPSTKSQRKLIFSISFVSRDIAFGFIYFVISLFFRLVQDAPFSNEILFILSPKFQENGQLNKPAR